MSQYVTTQFSTQFTQNVMLLSQQKGSRFRRASTEAPYTGKQGVPVEQFLATTAQRRTTRYPALTPVDLQSDRRWVYPADYDWPELIDSIDRLRMIVNPDDAYVQSGAAAMGRAQDDEWINAFFGTAKTGVDGTTAVTFPSGQQVSASEGASAATGMNIEKIKAGIQILLANEAFDPQANDPIFVGITAKENRALMDEIQIINSDYNSREKAVIADNFLMQWGRVQFIHSERLPTNGSSQRRCPMWVKEGMHMGIWQDQITKISERNDLGGNPWQVYMYMTVGATRLEEKKCVEIPCA